MLVRIWKKGTLMHCWWECKLVQPLWKTEWKFLKKLRVELLYDPAIPFLGIYPKNMKTLIQKDRCTPLFIAALFTIAHIWKQPKCPSIDEWLKKMWYIYIFNFHYFTKHLLSICNVESIVLGVGDREEIKPSDVLPCF